MKTLSRRCYESPLLLQRGLPSPGVVIGRGRGPGRRSAFAKAKADEGRTRLLLHPSPASGGEGRGEGVASPSALDLRPFCAPCFSLCPLWLKSRWGFFSFVLQRNVYTLFGSDSLPSANSTPSLARSIVLRRRNSLLVFPANPPSVMSLRMTRWHGTAGAKGLRRSAWPTARLEPHPIAPAIILYVVTCPRGILFVAEYTRPSNSVTSRFVPDISTPFVSVSAGRPLSSTFAGRGEAPVRRSRREGGCPAP